uniref:Uncharacterized protein n=1 Tax=Rhipicephalus microplus TaxID=6941 RepID=A0A6G5AHS1_RHIMP
MGGHAPSHIPRLVPRCVVWDPQGQNICKVCWTQSDNTMNRLCYSTFIMFSVLCFSAVSSNFFSMCSLILCRSCKPFSVLQLPLCHGFLYEDVPSFPRGVVWHTHRTSLLGSSLPYSAEHFRAYDLGHPNERPAFSFRWAT